MACGAKLAFSLLLVATSTSAAPANGFHGVWLLEVGKSDFGLCSPVTKSMLKVETWRGQLLVIELTTGASGDHVINRRFDITQRHRGTLTVRPEPRELSIAPEQWTLAGHRAEMVIERSCAASRQRLVFQRSVDVGE